MLILLTEKMDFATVNSLIPFGPRAFEPRVCHQAFIMLGSWWQR